MRRDADIDIWLRSGAALEDPFERMIETSISRIYLFAASALKLKKPVDMGFVDFTTLDKRRWAARRELEFNQPAAPDIYRRVRAIVRRADGALAFEGPGEVVDFAVEMRRFDEAAVLANQPARVDGALAEALGRMIARHHAEASRAFAGGAANLAYVHASNAELLHAEALAPGPARLPAPAVERLIRETQAAFNAAVLQLDQRLAGGHVRRCHGDLHLGNILLENGQPVLFDAIEFNDRLRDIDVLYDIAFLIMDLSFRGQGSAANRVMNGWLDEAARGFGIAAWDGLGLLPLFLSTRAAVRAHVNAVEGRGDAARAYLDAALAHLRPSAPILVALGGLSGSGKTTFARRVAPGLGPTPGAVVLRTDEIRKRQAGVAPMDRLPPSAYGAGSGRAVYRELFALAKTILAKGRSVVADGVFLDPADRRGIAAVAADAGVSFHSLWLEAPAPILESRLENRRNDASDADPAVLAVQRKRDPGVIEWPRGSSSATPPWLGV